MYTGRTPRKFIIEKRLEKAKNIIDEGNYMHLYEVFYNAVYATCTSPTKKS